MTTDEMQLLRDFRSDIPELDADTMARAYAYATSQPRRGTRLRLRLPATTRMRILGIAAVAGAAALVGVFSITGTTLHKGARGGDAKGALKGSTSNGLAVNSVPLSQALNDASTSFDTPLIFPNTSVLEPSEAPSTADEEWCPPPASKEPTLLCQVSVQFTSPFVNITYAPTAMTPAGAQYPEALDQYRAEIAQARAPADYQIVTLSDGTPALLDSGETGNLIEFRLGKLSIEIWAPNNNGTPTTVDAAALQGLAQSILDQAATTSR